MLNAKKPHFQTPKNIFRLIFENNTVIFPDWAIVLNPKKIFVTPLFSLYDENFTFCLRNLSRLKEIVGILSSDLSIYELMVNYGRFCHVFQHPTFRVLLYSNRTE